MKRTVLITVACVIVVVTAVVSASLRPRSNDAISDLRRYSTKETVLYYDPAELYKSMAMGGISPKPADLRPMQIRYLRISNVTFDQVSSILHRDLKASDDWHFSPTSTSSFGGYIQAYRGTSPTSVPMSEPDHAVLVMPDFSNYLKLHRSTVGSMSMLPKPTSYVVMDMRKLSILEVGWLKIKHLGRSPYSSQQDMASVLAP